MEKAMEEKFKEEFAKKFKVKNGQLYYEDDIIGKSEDSPGFSEYIFDEVPLGSGRNGIAFAATHKTLDVKQVVKLYFPVKDQEEISLKVREETKKNANPSLAGILAVIFDAGVYEHPHKFWYSKMESINSYCSIKDWKKIRDEIFAFKSFDVEESLCMCSAHVILNLTAGLLKTVIALYANGFIHGDLNPGNILWILEDGNDLESIMKNKYTKPLFNSTLGELEPYTIKLIDMGTSKANEMKDAGLLRDSFKLYDLMRSCFYPLFKKDRSIKDWLNFEIVDDNKYSDYAVEERCVIKKDGNEIFVHPHALAGDFFRLVCVLNLAFGIISNGSHYAKGCNSLNSRDINDFYTLMFGEIGNNIINGLSLECLITLRNIPHMDNPGNGTLINWKKVWDTYPLNLIDISPVFREKDMYIIRD